MSAAIEFKDVSKSFGKVEVLHDIDLTIDTKEVVVIVGPSGSGKSTLLRCINGLETITSGELIVNGISLPRQKRQIRQIRKEVGMVFQLFHLFPHMTALENVAFGPRKVRGASRSEAKEVATSILAKVGLADRSDHYPAELSGGQQQRVAIARAVVTNPKLILADEPTGNLDSANGGEVMALLTELNEDGTTIVMVTHSPSDAEKAHRIIQLFDGHVVTENIHKKL